MTSALSIDALNAIGENISWSKRLRRDVKIIVETDEPNGGNLKTIYFQNKTNKIQTNSCYVDLFVGMQTFTGSFIRSTLYSNFSIRTLIDGQFNLGKSVVWTRLSGFPAKDEPSAASSVKNFRGSFAENLKKFLDKKLPERTL